MKCPFCGHDEDKVIDSRASEEGRSIRRRRECLNCQRRFTTYENIEETTLMVIKKDGRREPFDRKKILIGATKACEKRPLPSGTVDKLVDDIEAGLYRMGKGEVSTEVIGDMVMERLKGLDYIAYIRFASVYREFTDITALKKAVDNLVDGEPVASPPTTQLPLLPTDKLAELARKPRKKMKTKIGAQTTPG